MLGQIWGWVVGAGRSGSAIKSRPRKRPQKVPQDGTEKRCSTSSSTQHSTRMHSPAPPRRTSQVLWESGHVLLKPGLENIEHYFISV